MCNGCQPKSGYLTKCRKMTEAKLLKVLAHNVKKRKGFIGVLSTRTFSTHKHYNKNEAYPNPLRLAYVNTVSITLS